MYISTKDWKNYISKLSALDKKAGELVQEYVQKNGFTDIDALIDYSYAVATKYGEGSAALSAAMYDAIVEAQGKFVAPAEVADTASYHEVAKTVNGTLKTSHNVNSVSGAVSRLVKRAGADTMLKNAQRDGAQFAWVPNGDTCAFCIALASRGWQNMSKKALKNGHAEHIHSNCDCTYAVRFDGKSGVAGYDPKKYEDMYYGADGDTPQDRINAIRRMKYQENKDRINAQKRAAYAERKPKDDYKHYRLSTIESDDNGKTQRIEIGMVAPEKADEAIRYFNGQIKDETIEHAIIIDKNGNVVHFIGDKEGVSIYGVDLDGAHVTHNHPKINGILSFGKDDFEFLRDNPRALLYCVNPEYEYSVKLLKSLDNISYNKIYRQAMEEYIEGADIQDITMSILEKMGYISYDKKRIAG